MSKKTEQQIIAECISTLLGEEIDSGEPKSRTAELSVLKARLKPLGFKVKTKTLSHGKHATFHHTESGQDLTGNAFSPEAAQKWKPLMDVLGDYDEITHDGEKVYGIKAGRK
jgi:hypothetical protein